MGISLYMFSQSILWEKPTHSIPTGNFACFFRYPFKYFFNPVFREPVMIYINQGVALEAQRKPIFWPESVGLVSRRMVVLLKGDLLSPQGSPRKILVDPVAGPCGLRSGEIS